MSKWDEIVTEPQEHNDKSYVYIVHAIQTGIGHIFRNLIAVRENGGKTRKSIDLTKEPNRISEMQTISCSIIGKRDKNEEGLTFESLHTWANVGVILKVPSQNILRVGNSDLGSNFVNPEEEIKKYKGSDIGNPEDILISSERQYNEVVVMGETEFGKVEVAGVFLNEYDDKPSAEEIKLANELARKTGTTLITIPKKERKLEDKPIHIETLEGKLSKISFTRGNREYYCNLSRNPWDLTWGLYATGDYGAPFMKNPEDVEMFIKELDNLPEEDKIKYAEILKIIPQQYELCKKYFNKEVSEEEINKFNYILESFDDTKGKTDFEESIINYETYSKIRSSQLNEVLSKFKPIGLKHMKEGNNGEQK